MRKNHLKLIVFMVAFGMVSVVTANPMGGSVAAGNIHIQQGPGSTTINQSSQRGIINWSSFNINSNETTHFNQPQGGVTLNRISPYQGASQIYGRLTATGQVILVNPAGIYFGPGSYVNVGGLVASTASITDRDFMAGNLRFIQNPAFNGAIVNQGTIIAANTGLVALMGNAVQNDGTIEANLGHAVLASGSGFSISFASNDNISFAVNGNTLRNARDKNGNTIRDGIRNTGTIRAGSVLVTAQAASGILDNAINMRGFVEARSVTALPGGGVILGGSGAPVRVAANIKSNNDVKINASDIFIQSPTMIDANTIVIGKTGNQLANNTNIASGVNLIARGGLVETSAHHLTINNVNVNTFGGNWILDPTDFVIDATTANNIISQLNSTNIKIITAASGLDNGDIFINAPLSYNSSNNLTLSAYRNIIGNESIANAGTGDVNLIADNTGTGIGTVSFAPGKNINLSGGNANIYYNPTIFNIQDTIYTGGTAPTPYMLINNVAKLANVLSNSNYALSKNIDASTLANSINTYNANFDGSGHIVSNLNVPLFNINNGSIINIGVSGNVSGNGLLANVNNGDIAKAFSYGMVTGTNDVGGLIGSNFGNLSDVASFAAVNGNSNVGGLVGNNSGGIDRAIATGANDGGLVGVNSGTINDSYYDSETTGVSGGNATSELMSASTFSNWDMVNTWGIVEGYSYPYLKVAYPTTPRVVAGQISEFTGYKDNPNWAAMPQADKSPDWNTLTPLAIAKQEVSLGVNGNLIDKTYSGANGRYYFLENAADIADNAPVIAFLSNSSLKANTITVAPTDGASMNHFDLALRTVLISDNGQNSYIVIDHDNWPLPLINPFNDSTYITQNDVVNAISNINSPDILYSISANNIFLDNNNYVISPNVFYLLSGNISANQGSISNYGTIGLTRDVHTTKLETTTNGNIYMNNVLWPLNGKPFDNEIQLIAADNIMLWGMIGEPNIDRNGVFAPGTLLSNAALTLSAKYSDQSIFIGPQTSTIFYVSKINILKGKWYYNYPDTLYTTSFMSSNPVDQYQLNLAALYQGINFGSGTSGEPVSNVEFLNVSGGDGSITDPYKIFDVYGLQGIASSERLLNANYLLAGEDVFGFGVNTTFSSYISFLWHNGLGFSPIGTLAHPFNGTFDGNNQDIISLGIWGESINRPNQDNIGIFGVTGKNAVIKNLMLYENDIVGRNNVGGLVGINNGLIENVEVAQGFIIGNNNVGTIAGINNGIIRDSGVYSNRTAGVDVVGGIAGLNTGLIDKSYAANIVLGDKLKVGGIAGYNTGTIRNSFWDVGVTGRRFATSIFSPGVLDHVTGGCLTSNTCQINSAKAVLSDPRTFLTKADGGYGYVSSSWNFDSDWTLNPGTSYPYHRIIFDPAGGPAQALSGTTFSSLFANQPLVMVWGPADVSGYTFSYFTITNTVTGADGSFYMMNSAFSILDGDFVVFTSVGGNTSGSVGFIANANPDTGMVGDFTNIPLPLALTNSPANSRASYNTVEMLALFYGLDLSKLIQSGTTAITSSASNFYKATEILYRSNLLPADIGSLYAQTYYQFGLVEEVKKYQNKYGIDWSNIDSLQRFQQLIDAEIVHRYDIKEMSAKYCGL